MIHLFNLNIEGDKHLKKISAFCKNNIFDIVCFQEVFQVDIPFFEKMLGMYSYFIPTMNVTRSNPYLAQKGMWGLAIFTKEKIVSKGVFYYVGRESYIPDFNPDNPNSGNRAVSWITIKVFNKTYTVATTHFTWSVEGKATKEQKTNMKKLLVQLKCIEPLILCGDFNAPRGKDIFKMLSDVYKDNIPEEIISTIDPLLHREKNLHFVVDGLFTASQYQVNDINIIDGLSDHKGICAILTST